MKVGTRHLNQFLKNINKTLGKTKNNTQMAITGKWHGCHFKNRRKRYWHKFDASYGHQKNDQIRPCNLKEKSEQN